MYFNSMSDNDPSHHKIKSMKCLVCNSSKVDVAHVKTVGSGGCDELWNLMPLCRQHHSEQHAIGIRTFASKYIPVSSYLFDNGWFIFNGKLLNEKNVTAEDIPKEFGMN